MSLKVVNFSDGFSSNPVPSVANFSPITPQRFVVSGTDITNGYLVLGVAPTSPSLTMFFWNGIEQIYGTDFDITGLHLNFLAGLNGLIQSGDNVTALYQ
jgi:hypothetical protein